MSISSIQQPLYRVRVVVPVPLYQTFDYLLDEEDYQQAESGSRVLVPFGQQKLVAIILEKISPDSAFPTFKLKKIFQLLDQKSLFDDLTFKILTWSAQYYQFPIGEVFHTALPVLLRKEKSAHQVALSVIWILKKNNEHDDYFSLKLSAKQHEVYQLLKQYPQGLSEDILHTHQITKNTLNALLKKGLIESHIISNVNTVQSPVTLAQTALSANPEQLNAIQKIAEKSSQYHSFLLDGLTGSGKTEVYLQVMYEILKQGKQVLVLVPEIGLTPQTIARFQSRFKANMVILHSALNDNKRLHAWLSAQSGQADIILGTRSAIFTPIPRLGLIILDEEHDLSYKQQDGFRYHARDIALYRAYLHQCPIILGSATPSLESYYLVQQQKLTSLQLNQRAGQAILPKLHTIDLTVSKKIQGISQHLIEQIGQHLQRGEQVLVFLNRRGYAPVLFCESCGWQADCPRCDAHFTVHSTPYLYLHCHHCGLIQTMPQQCPSCQHTPLKPLGMGTAKVEQLFLSLFPDYPILRIDRDSASKASDWDKFYQQIQDNKPLILLGTQMLSKGHHFPFVTLVAILDSDSGLFSVDFRASERTAQQIMQVAGRAGREQQQGVVYLQTYRPDHPMLKLLLEYDYRHFAQHSLNERLLAKLPPYYYSALIRVSSRDATAHLQFLQNIVQQLPASPHNPIHVWGPIPAPMARKAGYDLAHLVLFAKHRQDFHQRLHIWWQQVIQLAKPHHLKISLDIDPQEL